MNTVIFGPARIGDAPLIAAMSRHQIEADLPWNWTAARVAALMRDRDSLALTARAGSDLAGFVLAQFGADHAHIALLGVAPDYRRQGLGRRLMNWVEDSAAAAGLQGVTLEVRISNRSGQRFYARLGYHQIERITRYYSNIEDALRLERKLVMQRPTADG